MTLADDLKPLVNAIRAIPGELGLRPHTISVLLGTWSGDHTGEGTETASSTAILESAQNPKVRWLKQEERALADLPEGSCEIGPLTPSYPGGGFTLSTITSFDRGETLHLRIVGPQHPSGAVYRVTKINADHALHYTLQAVPVSSA
jgi:hypothetical protein